MKNFLFFALLLLFCNNFIEAQQIPTNAGIPRPENVLVVYKVQSDPVDTLGAISDSVKEYYRLARGIPAVNICPLDSLTSQTYTSDGSTHRVIIAQNGDIIQDSTNATFWYGATRHAWKYFVDNIANPIRQHLINNNLQNQIRYIVLCKGVPFKIQAGGDWDHLGGNLTVDGLLCMLNTENFDALLDSLFLKIITNAEPIIENPYFNADKDFSLNHRFLTNRYDTLWNGFNVQLSYLVSHLDGLSFDIVKGIIDSSKNADTTGTATWVLDADDNYRAGHQDFFVDTKEKLEALGFNVNWNDDGNWTTHNNGPVIGYSSYGTHAEDGNCAFTDSNWVRDSLQYFQFAPGAVFNTLESYNGNSIGTLNWRWVKPCTPQNIHTQGLATQFTQIGGTGMMGHAWEPYLNGVIYNEFFMPAYAIGYNYVDAAYMGMAYLAWQNVIIGDPLTRIFPEQVTKILTQDSTITSGDFTGKLIVPEGITLTVPHLANVNFKKNASLQINGNLNIHPESEINFYGYSSLIFDTANVHISQGTFNFYNNSYLIANKLSIGSGEHLHFYNSSILYSDSITISAGATIILNDESIFSITHDFHSIGTASNKVIFNSNNVNSSINILDLLSTEILHTIINNIHFFSDANISSFASINIAHSEFNGMTNGLLIFNANDVEIEDVTFIGMNNSYAGIEIENSKNIIITDCEISNFKYGILYGQDISHDMDSLLDVKNNIITNCAEGIRIQSYNGEILQLSKNNFSSPLNESQTIAIHLENLSEVSIESNIIFDYDYGIFLSAVANAYISDNSIQILNNSEMIESGIFSSSSQGIYLLNFISGYKKGIDLGNSSPKIGQNIITDNKATGIFVSSGSFPDLSEGMIMKDEGPFKIPISGLNYIYENGGEYEEIEPFIGEEIHVFDAAINLQNGCNSIEDNRPHNPPTLNTETLLYCYHAVEAIKAENNYWGNHPEYGIDPSHRIVSDVDVVYQPFLEEPCIKTKDGNFCCYQKQRWHCCN